jgi:hypothetical protein
LAEKSVIKVFALTMVGAALLSAVGLGAYLVKEIAFPHAPAQAEEQAFGTRISFASDVRIFPIDWRDPETRPVAAALPKEWRQPALEEVKAALSLYPIGLLRKHLAKVYLVSTLSFYDIEYGSVSDAAGKAVYLVYAPWAPEFTSESFHHEFSSVLIYQSPPKFRGNWAILNTDSYIDQEPDESRLTDDADANREFDPELFPEGFLNLYATSSAEEDFNTYAEALFSGNAQLWEAVEKHTKVKEKAMMAIAYYRSLDPKFSESFFRGLVQTPDDGIEDRSSVAGENIPPETVKDLRKTQGLE